jgi:hypothetical protein
MLERSDIGGYSTWEQVAGYFDGDGSPKVHVNVYTISLSVSWADQDIEIIQHIAQFLRNRGIFGNLIKFSRGDSVYYELDVSEGHNALAALKEMLPHLDKKRSQVKGAIDYLENRITGDEFITVLNEAVRTKKRSSWLITRPMPYTKHQGKRLGRSKRRHGCRVLTTDQLLDAKLKRDLRGLTFRELAKIYNVAPSTIHRSLTKYV